MVNDIIYRTIFYIYFVNGLLSSVKLMTSETLKEIIIYNLIVLGNLYIVCYMRNLIS